MTQRQAKVESLIQQQVAATLAEQLPNYRPNVTVTAVDVSPDLRNATVWLGVLEHAGVSQGEVLANIEELKGDIQKQVASTLSTKFVPKLSLKLDQGLAYAQHIDEVLKEL